MFTAPLNEFDSHDMIVLLEFLEMWRAQAGRSVSVTNDSDSDDWDTNPDYENEVDDKGMLILWYSKIKCPR